jgi:hypothetical protein
MLREFAVRNSGSSIVTSVAVVTAVVRFTPVRLTCRVTHARRRTESGHLKRGCFVPVRVPVTTPPS